MPDLTPNIGAFVSIDKPSLQGVFDVLKTLDYTLVGPTPEDGAIVYAEIAGLDDLPIGWKDEQAPGSYQLTRRNDNAYFGFVVGPHSWKKYLFPAELKVLSIERQNGGFEVKPTRPATPRYAFIGVRACELKAIGIQDRVFLGGPYVDPGYKARRQEAFVLAVNCTEPGGTCFCASMDAGPKVGPGFDLALTELEDIFVVEVGSEIGTAGDGAGALATHRRLRNAERARRLWPGRRNRWAGNWKRGIYPTCSTKIWRIRAGKQVAHRCLSCANCTQVCPTCFCSDVQEVSDLSGQNIERVRVWDSCFSLQFSHVHGGNIRPHNRSRYRQWLTHKFASWIDQFGTPGCVGCGRCITWCPVGIDVTEEISAIRAEA